MKKTVAFFLAIMMAVTFAGCTANIDENYLPETELSQEKVMPIIKIDTVPVMPTFTGQVSL